MPSSLSDTVRDSRQPQDNIQYRVCPEYHQAVDLILPDGPDAYGRRESLSIGLRRVFDIDIDGKDCVLLDIEIIHLHVEIDGRDCKRYRLRVLVALFVIVDAVASRSRRGCRQRLDKWLKVGEGDGVNDNDGYDDGISDAMT